MTRPPTWPSPANEILLRACLVKGPEAIAAWNEWRPESSFELVPALAGRLLPAAYENLREQGASPESLERIKGTYRYCWVKNSRQFAQLAKILRQLAQQGIPVMALKGLDVLLRYYPKLGMRFMEDVDLLVRPEHVMPTMEYLQSQGFKNWTQDIPKFVSANYGVNLEHEEGYQLDLHWHALDTCSWAGGDELLWERSTAATVMGMPLRFPCPEESLMIALVHGMQYPVDASPRWVCDAVHILQSSPDFNWPLLHEITQQRRTAWPVQQGLDYLHHWDPNLVPEESLGLINSLPISSSDRSGFRLMSEAKTETTTGKISKAIWLYRRRFSPRPSLVDWLKLPAHLRNRRGGFGFF
ncbi:MAG: hypothetical protein SynsKO_35140 [Synoicihabitans sp.]